MAAAPPAAAPFSSSCGGRKDFGQNNGCAHAGARFVCRPGSPTWRQRHHTKKGLPKKGLSGSRWLSGPSAPLSPTAAARTRVLVSFAVQDPQPGDSDTAQKRRLPSSGSRWLSLPFPPPPDPPSAPHACATPPRPRRPQHAPPSPSPSPPPHATRVPALRMRRARAAEAKGVSGEIGQCWGAGALRRLCPPERRARELRGVDAARRWPRRHSVHPPVARAAAGGATHATHPRLRGAACSKACLQAPLQAPFFRTYAARGPPARACRASRGHARRPMGRLDAFTVWTLPRAAPPEAPAHLVRWGARAACTAPEHVPGGGAQQGRCRAAAARGSRVARAAARGVAGEKPEPRPGAWARAVALGGCEKRAGAPKRVCGLQPLCGYSSLKAL